jgi:hypothetical protein
MMLLPVVNVAAASFVAAAVVAFAAIFVIAFAAGVVASTVLTAFLLLH